MRPALASGTLPLRFRTTMWNNTSTTPSAELVPEAQVPGFRAGRAPRKFVEHRFRKEVKDQVKSNLLMDSMAQVSDDQKLAAISEPDIDLAAVEVPDDGPMTFEFDIEVRPDFEMPNWKGLDCRTANARFHRKRCRRPVAAVAGSARPVGAVRGRRDGRRLRFKRTSRSKMATTCCRKPTSKRSASGPL